MPFSSNVFISIINLGKTDNPIQKNRESDIPSFQLLDRIWPQTISESSVSLVISSAQLILLYSQDKDHNES